MKLSYKTLSKIKSNTQNYILTKKEESEIVFPTLQKGKQSLFGETDADIAVFGGSAGSGKSRALLTDFARKDFIDNSNYRAVIFRRTYPEFTQAGGLVDESRKIYSLIKGIFAEKPHLEWRFPSGAKISFRHLQHEKTVYTYQGSQIARIGFDELTHFSEEVFFYLLSRNRSVSGIKPSVRATCNPDADSWVADFISWWIDPKTGYAIEERSGVVRYFVREGNAIYWADTRGELIERFNLKSKLLDMIPSKIRDEFLSDDDLVKVEDLVKSVTFIPATIFDNKALIRVNPTYLANLYALHPIERERLLKGNWKIKYEAGTVFDRTWFEVIDGIPSDWELIGKVRFWDLAATAKENAEDYHCYTSGTLVHKYERVKTVLSDGTEVREFAYVVADNLCEQKKVGEVELMLKNTAGIDGKQVAVRWEQEGGSSGKFVENVITNVIREYHPNHDVSAIAPQGDKLTRALPSATAASRGQIFLLRDAVWNSRFLNACQSFDGSKKTPPVNDIVDSLSGAFYSLENEFIGDRGEAVSAIVNNDPVNPFRGGISRGRR